jgi:hypothetical protein
MKTPQQLIDSDPTTLSTLELEQRADALAAKAPEQKVLRGRKSSDELMKIYDEQGVDGLTTDELVRVKAIVDLRNSDAVREKTTFEVEAHKRKQSQDRDKFYSRGKELAKISRDRDLSESYCKHKKAGRAGGPGWMGQGNDVNYSVIKHTMPWGETLVRCTRCGKSWKPPHTQDFATIIKHGKELGTTEYAPLTPEQRAKYDEAMRIYNEALNFNTDNISSSSGTWQFHSDAGDKTARNLIHEVTKDINLR